MATTWYPCDLTSDGECPFGGDWGCDRCATCPHWGEDDLPEDWERIIAEMVKRGSAD